jgi:glucan biosynthesis protein C
VNSNDTNRNRAVTQQGASTKKSARLHYLDWLRVLATLGVFLFHTILPFDGSIDWMINNAERSVVVTAIRLFISQWGMPLFFLLAGAGSCFALRRRTGRQFVSERFRRLVVPFIVSAILFAPFQTYLQAIHKGWSSWYEGPFLNLAYFSVYLDSRLGPDLGELFNPKVFINYGSHLWFMGYLFVFSLCLLPFFLWLKKDAGKRLISWLAGLCERRGGILVVILPLALIRIILQPRFPVYTAWTDFFFMLVFFVSGYILFADERFTRVIRRDGKLVLAVGITSTVLVYAAHFSGVGKTWLAVPGTAGFCFAWTLLSTVAWCWVIIMLYVGMSCLDFTNKWLKYSLETAMPFYMFHHPVIIVVAFYVVQWNAGILVKLAAVTLGSFVVTLGLTEIVRRIKPVRAMFGMKPKRRNSVQM